MGGQNDKTIITVFIIFFFFFFWKLLLCQLFYPVREALAMPLMGHGVCPTKVCEGKRSNQTNGGLKEMPPCGKDKMLHFIVKSRRTSRVCGAIS